MTREEAIGLLMNISAYDVDNQNIAKQEAIELAIKALEKEYLDRMILLGELKNEFTELVEKLKEGNNTGRMYGVEMALGIIKEKIAEV